MDSPARYPEGDPGVRGTPGSNVHVRLQEFHRVLDSYGQHIKQLRRDLYEKIDRDATRGDGFDQVFDRFDELERYVEHKANSDDVALRLEELVDLVSHKTEIDEFRALKLNIKGELSQKISTEDLLDTMSSKADVEYVSRGQKELQSRIDEEVSSMKNAMEQSMREMRASLEEKLETNMIGMRQLMENQLQSNVVNGLSREAKLRQESIDSLQDGIMSRVRESVKTREFETAVRDTCESLISDLRMDLKSEFARNSAAQLSEQVAQIADQVQLKADREELGKFVKHDELQMEWSQKANITDVRAWCESKAEQADVQSFIDRHTRTWQSMNERIDTGLTGEADMRRKGDASTNEMLAGELESIKRELQHKLDAETSAISTQMKTLQTTIESDLQETAKVNSEELEAACTELKEELKSVERGITSDLEKESAARLHSETTLPRVERQLTGLEEAMKLQQEASAGLQQQLYDALESISHDAQHSHAELRALETKVSEDMHRMREDTDVMTQRHTEVLRDYEGEITTLKDQLGQEMAHVVQGVTEQLNQETTHIASAISVEQSMRAEAMGRVETGLSELALGVKMGGMQAAELQKDVAALRELQPQIVELASKLEVGRQDLEDAKAGMHLKIDQSSNEESRRVQEFLDTMVTKLRSMQAEMQADYESLERRLISEDSLDAVRVEGEKARSKLRNDILASVTELRTETGELLVGEERSRQEALDDLAHGLRLE
eukprot:gene32106-40599_t